MVMDCIRTGVSGRFFLKSGTVFLRASLATSQEATVRPGLSEGPPPANEPLPSNAAPASPAPPNLRNFRRLMTPVVSRPAPVCLVSPILDPSRTLSVQGRRVAPALSTWMDGRFMYSRLRKCGRPPKWPPPLPEVMDLGPDGTIVDLARPPHGLVRQRRHPCGGHVILHLGGVLAAGDGAGDRGVHEDPTQRELREGVPLGHDLLQLLRRLQARLEVDAGEGLAAVESLPFPVEGAVVVRGEGA